MKQLSLIATLWLMGIALPAIAKEGYHINLKMPDMHDTVVYLVHYYGENRPRIYIADSTKFDKSGTAVFDSKDADFVGGIYMILLKDKAQTNFEVLLNRGDNISVTTKRSDLPNGIVFKNSPENERFAKYLEFIKGFSEEQKGFEAEIKEARNATDTAAVRKKAVASAKRRTKYMRDYAAQYPGTLLAKIFNALQSPEVPEGTHYLADGVTKDSTFAYRYYKAHFWDDFDLQDDRLVYTPLYDAKLEEYFTKMVLPWPDSVSHEADMLLRKTKGTKDLFHYTLFWVTKYVDNSKVMGMDEAFVYLVENYYMKGDAVWMKSEDLAKYIARVRAIAPNVIGNLAPELKQPNVYTQKEERLSAFKAKYTLLVFYSPTCGHCEHELPLLDSAYEAVLKDKGVKVFTVATEGEEKQVKDFLEKHKLDKKWTNTWDPQQTRDFRDKYDVLSTPMIYLLDEKKIIRGKRLDHSNIGGLVEMLEKKGASPRPSPKERVSE